MIENILAATLLTDRKPAFPVSLEYLVQEPLIQKIYINVETDNPMNPRYREIGEYLAASGKHSDIDYWWVNSRWMGRPQYDQDPARFMPIAQGRNMALDWAIINTMMDQSISHILFVDSDVRPHTGGLRYLLDLNKPLTGGLVPGRGAHRTARYVFGQRSHLGSVITCEHGTSGYMLLQRSLFEVQRFRVGPHIDKRGTNLCDDPAYAADAYHSGLADAWYIDDRATADHVDDPNNPLKLDEAINDYINP